MKDAPNKELKGSGKMGCMGILCTCYSILYKPETWCLLIFLNIPHLVTSIYLNRILKKVHRDKL